MKNRFVYHQHIGTTGEVKYLRINLQDNENKKNSTMLLCVNWFGGRLTLLFVVTKELDIFVAA
jgi:hypothetical protein